MLTTAQVQYGEEGEDDVSTQPASVVSLTSQSEDLSETESDEDTSPLRGRDARQAKRNESVSKAIRESVPLGATAVPLPEGFSGDEEPDADEDITEDGSQSEPTSEDDDEEGAEEVGENSDDVDLLSGSDDSDEWVPKPPGANQKAHAPSSSKPAANRSMSSKRAPSSTSRGSSSDASSSPVSSPRRPVRTAASRASSKRLAELEQELHDLSLSSADPEDSPPTRKGSRASATRNSKKR